MNPTRLFAATAFVALAGFAWQTAQAQPAGEVQRRAASDGAGRAAGLARGSFETAAGGQGRRSAGFRRNDDGSFDAGRQGRVTTAEGGSAEQRVRVGRDADGTATAERSTQVTNARTGVDYEGAASWTRGQGVSRSGSCSDASGQTVSCGSAR